MGLRVGKRHNSVTGQPFVYYISQFPVSPSHGQVKVNTNLTSPLAPRNVPPSSLFTALNQA
jgi:hypothetical protein